MNFINDKLKKIIIEHEGLELKPYRDTEGHLTIGVGRNLDSMGLNKREVLFMLDNDLDRCYQELNFYDWFKELNEVRKEVMIEMVFNLGLPRFLRFKKMIGNLKIGDYVKAADEMLDSKWSKQVGDNRSINMANRLINGHY